MNKWSFVKIEHDSARPQFGDNVRRYLDYPFHGLEEEVVLPILVTYIYSFGFVWNVKFIKQLFVRREIS